MDAREAGQKMHEHVGELAIETERAVVPMDEFDSYSVGWHGDFALIELEHTGNQRQQFDVGRDVMGLGPDGTIVMWCGDQGIELSMLWAGSEMSLDVSPDDAVSFDAELLFAEATPL